MLKKRNEDNKNMSSIFSANKVLFISDKNKSVYNSDIWLLNFQSDVMRFQVNNNYHFQKNKQLTCKLVIIFILYFYY